MTEQTCMKFICQSCLMQLNLGPTFCFSLFWKYMHLLLTTDYVNLGKVKTFPFISLTSTNSAGIHWFSSEILNHGPKQRIRCYIFCFLNLKQLSQGEKLLLWIIRHQKRTGQKEEVLGDKTSRGGLLFSQWIFLVAQYKGTC